MRALALALAALLSATAQRAAADVHIAVAQSFAPLARELSSAFERASGENTVISSGSTGKLYAQIANGAPFDVFLAADAARPARLEREGLAVATSRFTYALGRLALWSADPARVDPEGRVLESGTWRHLAIANPDLAPYGKAALEVLEGLGLRERLAARLVRGEDIGQTFQFVVSGNAELGFVAWSQLVAIGEGRGSRWLVPESLHAPIEQQAVWLARAAENAGAGAFLAFLRSPDARARIASAGFGVPAAP